MDPRTTPWKVFPFSFHFPWYLIWFHSHGEFYGHVLPYRSFTLLNEDWYSSMRLSQC